MKFAKLSIAAAYLSAMTSWGQTYVSLHSEDFEGVGGGTGLNTGNNMIFSTVADPTGAGRGSIGQGDVGLGATEWAAVNTVPGSLQLPASVEPGISEFRISMMVYVPTGTTYTVGGDGPDRMGLVVRWNGLQSSAKSIYVPFDTIVLDTWTPIELTGTIPALDGDGNAVTYATPIISFHDEGNDAETGVAGYMDDYSFEVTVSNDDPNLPLQSELSFGEVDQDGGSHTQKIVLNNSGSAQDLTITGVTLSGVNADLVTLEALALPLVLEPGEERDVSITLDPGSELGFLSAAIEVASDDSSSPTLMTNITATSVVPFDGREFILNGDFETGDLTSWRVNARINATTDQARSGTISAVYNLPGANQWNDARIEHLDSDPVDSIPITPEMYGKEFFYSAWYYRPLVGGMGVEDSCQTIMRWNGVNPGNGTVGRFMVGTAPTDTWMRVTGTGTIPAIDSNGDAVTQVTILWSFQDVGADSAGGEIMYIDDISLKIDAPIAVPDVDPVITGIEHDALNNQVIITYEAAANFAYAIERSTGLTPAGDPSGWEVISPSEISDVATRTYTDTGAPVASAKYFYRVKEAFDVE